MALQLCRHGLWQSLRNEHVLPPRCIPNTPHRRTLKTSIPLYAARKEVDMKMPWKKGDPPLRRQIVRIERNGTSFFKTFMPISPGLRHVRLAVHEHLHKGKPERQLTIEKRRTGGRNDRGRITVAGRGGGHKRRIRLVDFFRRERGPQEVLSIQYDPGRTAHIALIKHKETGMLSYILASTGLRAGDTVESFRSGIPDHFLINIDEMDAKIAATAAIQAQAASNGLLSLSPLPENSQLSEGQLKLSTAVESNTQITSDGTETISSTTPSLPSSDQPAPNLPGQPGYVSTNRNELLQAVKAEGEVVPLVQNEDGLLQGEPVSLAPRMSSSGVELVPGKTDKIDVGILRTLAIKEGNCLPLRLIPNGTRIFNIALLPYGKAVLCRSAGTWGLIHSQFSPSGKYCTVELQSGEHRLILRDCVATIGQASNVENRSEKMGKAGRRRWMGFRPKVRGVAMSTSDHPMGGGRGKSKGNKSPQDRFGNIEGRRTRRPGSKGGNKMVVVPRRRLRPRKKN